MELTDQVVLVTGAGRNLGSVIAKQSALAGAAVGVMGRGDRRAVAEVVAEIEMAGGRAVPLLGDVRNASAVKECVDQCAAQLGAVTSVVHAAAYRSHWPIVSMPYEEWRAAIDVTLGGAYHLVTSSIASMRERGFGRYVFIGGASIVNGLPKGCAHVASAKSGLRGLTRALTQENGRSGITANMVSPGTIETPTRREARPIFDGFDPIEATALGRAVTPREVAAAVTYLLSAEAQPVSGQVISVDGGVFGFSR